METAALPALINVYLKNSLVYLLCGRVQAAFFPPSYIVSDFIHLSSLNPSMLIEYMKLSL